MRIYNLYEGDQHFVGKKLGIAREKHLHVAIQKFLLNLSTKDWRGSKHKTALVRGSCVIAWQFTKFSKDVKFNSGPTTSAVSMLVLLNDTGAPCKVVQFRLASYNCT